MAPAPPAVFAQLDPLGVVALALVRLIVPALADVACERHSDPDISTGHLLASRRAWLLARQPAGALTIARLALERV
jgi:hypothetical protein